MWRLSRTTKLSMTRNGENTARLVHHAYGVAAERRMGPVHLALPGDVARYAVSPGGEASTEI